MFRLEAPFTKSTQAALKMKKCNACSLEAITIPRHVKLQHIKGIANILADSVSRLKAVGLNHDLHL